MAENVLREHNMCYLFAYLLPMYGGGGQGKEKGPTCKSVGKSDCRRQVVLAKKRWLVICARIIGLESPPVRR